LGSCGKLLEYFITLLLSFIKNTQVYRE
jgi:hypothetical protein